MTSLTCRALFATLLAVSAATQVACRKPQAILISESLVFDQASEKRLVLNMPYNGKLKLSVMPARASARTEISIKLLAREQAERYESKANSYGIVGNFLSNRTLGVSITDELDAGAYYLYVYATSAATLSVEAVAGE